jgi:Uncharacterized MobA-related protein
MIAGVLLAAGGARRFGSQKLIAPFRGVPLVRHAAVTLASATDQLIVVVGNGRERVRDALHGLSANFVENAAWADGLASSLRCGIAAVAPEVHAIIVALGDQPEIDPLVIRAVAARWRETRQPIVVTRYADAQGHPTLFARELFGEIMGLTGDRGARRVIDRVPERVGIVEVQGTMPKDIDTALELSAADRHSLD